MLPINWNGSNGAIHFGITVARNSFTVCACTAVATSASAQSAAAVNFFIGSSRLCLLLFEHALVFRLGVQGYVAVAAAGNSFAAGIFCGSGGIAPRVSSPRTRGPIRRVLSV